MDTDRRADEAWVLDVQRKLYQWSQANPDDAWRDMWNWVIDIRTLRHAWRRIASNKGRRTAGVDGMTVRRIQTGIGEQRYLERVRAELCSGAYRPSPSKRMLIPKSGKPGQFRPLGVPTVKDRVVQAAVKIILEPIFEAQFWRVSYGFRPGRNAHGALEHIRRSVLPHRRDRDGRRRRLPYAWVIEGDVKGCFDNINHHLLLNRLRARVADRKTVRLVKQFLKAGVLSEDSFLRTEAGTPQGGIISPLLANIALSAIEERYERWVEHRSKLQARRTCDGVQAANSARQRDRKRSRTSTPSFAAGRITIATALALIACSPASTGTPTIGSGAGCVGNAPMRASATSLVIACRAHDVQRASCGGTATTSNTCSPGRRSAAIASDGCGRPTSPSLLESRMRNERRTSGSVRGCEKPMAEMSHGAHTLLFSRSKTFSF